MTGKSDIYVYPEDIWDYITRHRSQLERSIVIVAEDDAYGVEIALELRGKTPVLVVYIDDREFESDFLTARSQTEEYAREMYDSYLRGYSAQDSDADSSDEDEEDSYLDKEIAERDEELRDAFDAFLEAVLGDAFPMIKADDADEMMDEVLALLSALGCEVYRPCFLDAGDGTEVFVEYPYSETTPEEPGGNIN